MKATITSKGQITIPVRIRERLRLKEGDILEFDENASILTARRYIDPDVWEKALEHMGSRWRQGLSGHPWDGKTSREILEETRGEVSLPGSAKPENDPQ